MIPTRFLATLSTALLLSAPVLPLQADVSLPAIFGDHMVLQQGIKLPVWGKAAPGEAVSVVVGSSTGKTTADNDGKWRVELPALSTDSQPVTLTATGKNTVTVNDVLVGDVWICSGQSNMEFSLGRGKPLGGAHNAATVVPAANDPELRFFVVAHNFALDPLSDVSGHWEVCTPTSAATFSAVGYFFGSELRQTTKCPVGLIGTYWGGTLAQCWTSLDGLKKAPEIQHYAKEFEVLKSRVLAAHPDGLTFPPNKVMPRPGFGTALYNAMLAPLIPYGIKGVIWYHGESNERNAAEYRFLLPGLISDWREKWGQGDFPFLFVQLASCNRRIPSWPYLREAQLKALSLPNTGMASAVDVGNPGNIHPLDKADVGHRLALAARHVAYGENLVYSGPIYDAMKADKSAIRITFTQLGSGLIIGQAPWVPAGLQPLPTDKLLGFTIAGDDKKFVPADARIEGNAVIVSSPDVSTPVAVRYAWANAPQGNLYNHENLPASPFRTDDWSDPAMGRIITTAN